MYRQIAAALDAAISRPQIDDIGRMVWRALGAGAITDDEAEQLGARVAARQKAGQRAPQARCRGSAGRRQRSPDKQRSIERRRRLAAAGGLPPSLACKFTVAQLAVLKIVADEIRDRGVCDRCLAEIAARAGCCRRTAKDAIGEARRLGLLIVKERRRRGLKNLPNVVTIVSAEWSSWLRIGGKNLVSPDKGFNLRAKRSPAERLQGEREEKLQGLGQPQASPEEGSRLQPTSRRHQGRAAAS